MSHQGHDRMRAAAVLGWPVGSRLASAQDTVEGGQAGSRKVFSILGLSLAILVTGDDPDG